MLNFVTSIASVFLSWHATNIILHNFLCHQGEAVSTIVGHTQCVSSVIWPQHETIYSASWDHSVRRWDVETGKDSWNLVSENDLILPFFYFVCMVKANDVSCG